MNILAAAAVRALPRAVVDVECVVVAAYRATGDTNTWQGVVLKHLGD